MDTTGRVDVLALFGNNVRATVFSIAYGFIPFIYLPALSIGINSCCWGCLPGCTSTTASPCWRILRASSPTAFSSCRP